MKELLIYIFILVCSDCVAQISKGQIMAYENDVKTYGSAVSKIVKQNDLDGGIEGLTVLINRCEKEIDYSRTMLSSFYKGRGHGYLKKKEYLYQKQTTPSLNHKDFYQQNSAHPQSF